MRIKKLIVLLAGATLLASAPQAQKEGYAKKAKLAYGEEKSLTAAEEKEVVASFERALRRELPSFDGECEAEACKDGCTEECQAATAAYLKKIEANPVAYYAEAFAKKPASWQVLRPLVQERFTAASTGAQERRIMVDLVAHAPYDVSAELGAKLFSADERAFTEEHVLAFAMRGGEPFEERLYQRARACNAEESPCDVRAAAFFALHGNDVGRKALVRVVKHASLDRGSITQPVIAALALDRLGEEGLFQTTLERVQEAAFAALDAGDLERARELGLSARYFRKLADEKGKWIELAWLDEKLAGHCAAEASGYESPEDVFLLIESVSPM